MRTMFVVNSLASGYPSTKGALAIQMPDGSFSDLTDGADGVKKHRFIDFINSMGNGSVRTFTLNPFDFSYSYSDSGSATSVVPSYSITYPTGNARTDSMTDQFVGGIIVKQFHPDKNIWKTLDVYSVEVLGANGVVPNADVKVAFKAAMAAITGTGKYIATAVHTAETSSVFNLGDANYYIELVGDLRWWKMVRTAGVNLSYSGKDVAKFERELAPNMGYIDSSDDAKLFANSNFIADTSAVYNVVTLVTRTEAQRPLLPNAAGLPKELHLFFKKDGGTVDAVYAAFKLWCEALSNEPSGYVSAAIDAIP